MDEPRLVGIAHRKGVRADVPAAHDRLGVSRNVREGLWPLNGLRHLPEGGTCGWYVWAGEQLMADDDFFVPLHVEHLNLWRPEALPYLELPPGWRFLIAPGYEDVWFDPELLNAPR